MQQACESPSGHRDQVLERVPPGATGWDAVRLCDVALDCRLAGRHGIGTYLSALLQGAWRAGSSRTCSLTLCGPAEAIGVLPQLGRARVVPFSAPAYSLREQLAAARLPVSARLWHAPHFNAPLARREPLVVTVHDVTHLALGRRAFPRWAVACARALMAWAVARARRVIVVSQATRRALLAHVRVQEEKIRVVQNGVLDVFFCAPKGADDRAIVERFGLERPYFLYVGSLRAHKNVGVLLDAFSRARRGAPDLELRMVGAEPGRFQHGTQLAGSLEQPGVHLHAPLAADVLRTLYAHALAVAVPSRSEGFGYPLAEAFACGAPAIAARAASLPEVGGEAALYFDPDSPGELAGLLADVARSEALRRALAAKGRARAEAFRTARMWAETEAVYREVLGEL